MRLLVSIKPERFEEPAHSYCVLAEIDWFSRKVSRHLVIPMASYGTDRGFMVPSIGGVVVVGRRAFLTVWNFLVEVHLDSFSIVNSVSNRFMADLHGITTDGQSLWIAATAIDSVLKLDLATLELQQRWGADDDALKTRAGGWHKLSWKKRIRGVPAFRDGEYRFVHKSISQHHHHHLNDVAYRDGQLYVMTKGWFDGTSSAVLKMDPEGRNAEFLVRPGGFKASHDLVFAQDRLFVTESVNNGVAWLDRSGRIERRKLQPEPYFLRGMVCTGKDFIVGYSTLRGTGLQPLLVGFDGTFSRETQRMNLGMFYPDGTGNIHGIALLPE